MKQSVFAREGRWYKGNLHTHTTLSDGKQTPGERVAAYKAKGYDFLAITDHNVYASYPEFCREDFLVLPATERDAVDTSVPCGCVHVLGISREDEPEKVEKRLTFTGELGTDGDYQALLDQVAAAGQLAILAHPVWSRMTIDHLLQLQGYLGIEIYNTTCDHRWYTGKCDYMIDSCLRKGKKVLLFATDDCHTADNLDMFGGWIQVKAKNLTHEEILRQIQAGSFYASTGPEIYDFGLEDGKVYVACSPCASINFITYEQLGHSIVGEGLTQGSHQLTGQETFVRCECVDKYGKIAYTNPIFLRG